MLEFRLSDRGMQTGIKFRVGEIIKSEFVFKRRRMIEEKIIEEQEGPARRMLELFNSFLRQANSLQETVPRVGKERYKEALEKLIETWYELRDYLPSFTREELKEFIRERVRTSRIDRYLDLAEFLAKRDRPAKFTVIVEENRFRESFSVKESAVNKTFLRVLKSLERIRLIIKRHYYFRLFNLAEQT